MTHPMKFNGRWRVSFYREGSAEHSFLDRDFQTLTEAWRTADTIVSAIEETDKSLLVEPYPMSKDYQPRAVYFSITDLQGDLRDPLWGGVIDQQEWT